MVQLPPVLVSSTAAFADTWEPFAALIERYWPNHPELYLVTERLPSSAPKTMIPLVTDVPDGPRHWSEGMREAIGRLSSDFFLYMQDDYFIRRPVDVGLLRETFAFFREEREASSLRVRETKNSGPWERYSRGLGEPGDIWRVSYDSPYLCSLQAAFWRSADFEQLLRVNESPWEFERYGSTRAQGRNTTMLCLSIERYRGLDEPLPYLATGVIKGRWHPEVPALFRRHSLDQHLESREVMANRGFLSESGPLSRYLRRWFR